MSVKTMIATTAVGRYYEVLPAFQSAQRRHDRETSRHASRVGRMSAGVGQAMGLGIEDLHVLTWSGILHDLGKLGVRQELLAKPGLLSIEEWEEIQRHPVIGSNILLALALSLDLTPVAAAVRSHHEHWDGSGYPDGLAGAEIPLFGRIVGIADVYDALTHLRFYRPIIYTRDEAVDIIVEGVGSQFDPDIADVFLRLEQRSRSLRSETWNG